MSSRDVIVDTGPLIVLADKAAWRVGVAWLAEVRAAGLEGFVPPEVVVEFLRGTPDLTRAQWWLSRLSLIETGPELARRAGRMLRNARDNSISVVDALVVQHAVSRDCGILTSDAGDLRKLVAASAIDVDILELPWPK